MGQEGGNYFLFEPSPLQSQAMGIMFRRSRTSRQFHLRQWASTKKRESWGSAACVPLGISSVAGKKVGCMRLSIDMR